MVKALINQRLCSACSSQMIQMRLTKSFVLMVDLQLKARVDLHDDPVLALRLGCTSQEGVKSDGCVMCHMGELWRSAARNPPPCDEWCTPPRVVHLATRVTQLRTSPLDLWWTAAKGLIRVWIIHRQPQVGVMPATWPVLDKLIPNAQLAKHVAVCLASAWRLTHFSFISTSGAVCVASPACTCLHYLSQRRHTISDSCSSSAAACDDFYRRSETETTPFCPYAHLLQISFQF